MLFAKCESAKYSTRARLPHLAKGADGGEVIPDSGSHPRGKKPTVNPSPGLMAQMEETPVSPQVFVDR